MYSSSPFSNPYQKLKGVSSKYKEDDQPRLSVAPNLIILRKNIERTEDLEMKEKIKRSEEIAVQDEKDAYEWENEKNLKFMEKNQNEEIIEESEENEISKAINNYFIFYHAVKRNKPYHKREYSKSIQ